MDSNKSKCHKIQPQH